MDSRTLVKMIQEQTELIFCNMSISMKTCPWEGQICGTPVWRYFYHTLHSCDKWYRNPNAFAEPAIHAPALDKVDLPCDKTLTEKELWDYFDAVRGRTLAYLNELTDAELYEKPQGCPYTRLELVLGQFRHFMCHIGIFDGLTIAQTGKYPTVLGLEGWQEKLRDGKLYDE
ncbi:MAG: hypothetical protein PHD32_12175 [Eubacteriales bacterium]|nr:hypothetical protein [Eubacteriales bacterium]